MSHETARLLLTEAEKCLELYQQKLAAGEGVELEGFEKIVQQLCAHVAEMPRDEAQIYGASLNALGESLDMLGQVLAQRRDELKNKIQGLNKSSAAANAYGNQGDNS
jgi:hypothetical protein